eukprot:g20732.t1
MAESWYDYETYAEIGALEEHWSPVDVLFASYYPESQYLAKSVSEHCDFVKAALGTKPSGGEGKKKKVAYLIMGPETAAFDQKKVWEEYFENCPQESANLYVHAFKATSEVLEKGDTDIDSWKQKLQKVGGKAKFVPTVKTGWGQLVGGMWWLTVNALADPENEQFLFVSQDSVPLKDCKSVTEALLRPPDKGSASEKHLTAASKSNICLAPYRTKAEQE